LGCLSSLTICLFFPFISLSSMLCLSLVLSLSLSLSLSLTLTLPTPSLLSRVSVSLGVSCEESMEPNSPKKIQFSVPLFQSQLDPQASEHVSRKREREREIEREQRETEREREREQRADSLCLIGLCKTPFCFHDALKWSLLG